MSEKKIPVKLTLLQETQAFSLGLIGYPLEHSLSPRMHNEALKALGLPGDYRLYPIPPLPEGAQLLGALLDRLRRGEIHGLNVTIPHKQPVMDWLDDLSTQAREIGAVNTLYMQAGRLVGDNTDAAGFLADLGRLLPASEQPEGQALSRDALVLGAGGSARAVVFALRATGWHVTVAARRLEQAQALVASLHPGLANGKGIRAVLLNASAMRALPPPQLIVNTTPVGMYRLSSYSAAPGLSNQPARQIGEPPASPWPDKLPFPKGAVLYDLVYNPPETALIKAARAAGLQVSNGLGMLVEQAALAFERWTSRTAPRAIMTQALNG